MIDTEEIKKSILNASCLQALLNQLEEVADLLFELEEVEDWAEVSRVTSAIERVLPDLPVWGESPADTQGVWSWDQRFLLVSDGWKHWQLIPREGE